MRGGDGLPAQPAPGPALHKSSTACPAATACHRIKTAQGPNPALPLVYVLENRSTNQLLFLVRPSASDYDYVLSFSYNQARTQCWPLMRCLLSAHRGALQARRQPPSGARFAHPAFADSPVADRGDCPD